MQAFDEYLSESYYRINADMYMSCKNIVDSIYSDKFIFCIYKRCDLSFKITVLYYCLFVVILTKHKISVF